METVILVIHILIAIALVAMVLIQQGRGADAGASFGAGASATLFGSAGNATFFTKLTTVLAIVFFVTSLGLALLSRTAAENDGLLISEEDEVPAMETVTFDAESEVPAVGDAASESIVPDLGSSGKQEGE